MYIYIINLVQSPAVNVFVFSLLAKIFIESMDKVHTEKMHISVAQSHPGSLSYIEMTKHPRIRRDYQLIHAGSIQT